MRRRGAVAALAGAVLALGAGTADAITLPDLSDATNADVKRAAPDFTNRQIKRAAIRAFESGAKPRKLRRSSPAWYTETKKSKRPQGEGDTTMAPVDAPLPGEIGIRPGSMMISPFICTMNFIFQKGEHARDRDRGPLRRRTSRSTLLTLAPGGGNPVLVELGRVLLKRNAGIGKDYALVEIPPELHSGCSRRSPSSAARAVSSPTNDPQPVAHYGHGVGIGTGGTPRAGMGFALDGGPDRRQGHRLGLGRRLDHLGRPDQRRRLGQRRPRRHAARPCRT